MRVKNRQEHLASVAVGSLHPKPRLRLPERVGNVISLFDFHPEEIARQMTLVDFKMFSAIKPSELLNQAWCRPKYKHKAPNLLQIIDRVNSITKWVATAVLSQRTPKDRACRMILFIKLANYLYKMHNFNSMVAVIGSLYHSSIQRLSQTWSKLEKMDKKMYKTYKKMYDFIVPTNHFRRLRHELEHIDPPCIPYLGLFMADLTLIDHGNPNFTSDHLINFTKCRLIYTQVRTLKTYQRQPYNFEEIPALVGPLKKFHCLDEDSLTEMSLKAEPRKLKAEN
jgi:hypothetical protein